MHDHVEPTALHRITTVHAVAGRLHRALAQCPRQHSSVDVAVCATCPHARGFVGGAPEAATRSILCSVDRSAPVHTPAGTVGSLMRRDLLCVHADVTIDDVVLLFIERSIGGVPVVDENNEPIGMIAKTDLLATYARKGRGQGCSLLDSFDVDDVECVVHPESAVDVMQNIAFTLREGDSIARAAELFASQHVLRAPVVGADGKVVGVLTSFDIVRGLAGAA